MCAVCVCVVCCVLFCVCAVLCVVLCVFFCLLRVLLVALFDCFPPFLFVFQARSDWDNAVRFMKKTLELGPSTDVTGCIRSTHSPVIRMNTLINAEPEESKWKLGFSCRPSAHRC